MVLKKPSLAKTKKKAWDAFSLWVRTADAKGEMNKCITCERLFHYKKLYAGHFIPGRHNAILFDERGVHPQCYYCNIIMGSNPIKYYKYMLKHYGQEVIDELDKLSTTTVKYTVSDYLELEKYYKELTNKTGGVII
jgi:hypothetical protein